MINDLTDWLLEHYGQEQFQPGLDRISYALNSLLPKLQTKKIITIAGTNGKGETTLRLSHLLDRETHCVWTSPHIESITERFRSEEGEIDYSELKEIVLYCHEEVLKEKYQLSFYEFLFFVFCTWSYRRNPKYLLLEVGLGGRLDAVNVFNADILLMPSISRDHQEFLGNRYEQILNEKMAILRPGKVFIHYLYLQYLREKVTARAEKLEAKVISLEEIASIPHFDFTKRNQLLAYAAYLVIRGESAALTNGTALQKWTPDSYFLPFRGQVLRQNGEWIFFGSHNLDGVRKLIQFLSSGTYNFSRPPYDAVITSFSKRNEKDIIVMLKMLKSSGLGKVVITTFDHPKAASKESLARLAHQEGLEFVERIDSNIQDKNKRVLVTGSYYFIGELYSRLRSRTATHSRG